MDKSTKIIIASSIGVVTIVGIVLFVKSRASNSSSQGDIKAQRVANVASNPSAEGASNPDALKQILKNPM